MNLFELLYALNEAFTLFSLFFYFWLNVGLKICYMTLGKLHLTSFDVFQP